MGNQTFEVDIKGKTYDVDAPDAATAWKWANHTHLQTFGGRQMRTREQIAADIDNDPISRGAKEEIARSANVTNVAGRAVSPELLAGNPVMRFSAGAAAPVIGAGQLAGNLLGMGESANSSVAQMETMRRAGMAETGDKTDVAGTIGNLLSPVNALAFTKLAPAATNFGRIKQSAALGAGMGLAAPVEDATKGYAGAKTEQVVGGAAVGGAVPAIGAALRPVVNTIKKAVEPITEAGRQAIMRRYVETEYPVPQAREHLAQVLRNNPGGPVQRNGLVMPTTAGDRIAQESLDRGALGPFGTRIASMEETLAKGKGVADASNSIRATQEDARLAALDRIGRGPVELESAIRTRANTAATNYAHSNRRYIIGNGELFSILRSNPLLTRMMPEIDVAATAARIPIPEKNRSGRIEGKITPYLDLIKKKLDDAVRLDPTTGRASVGTVERNALMDTRKQLVNWMDNTNLAYAGARNEFATQSVPINQMQVGQDLRKQLVNSLGTERAASFSNAVDNSHNTIRRSTGENRFEHVDKILSQPQMGAVRGVQANLARDVERKALVKGVNANDVLFVAEGGKNSAVPAMFSRPATIANWLMKRMGQGADEKIAKSVGMDLVANPGQFADRYLSGAPTISPQRQAVADILRRIEVTAPTFLLRSGE